MVGGPKTWGTASLLSNCGPFMGELVHWCLEFNELLEHVQLILSCLPSDNEYAVHSAGVANGPAGQPTHGIPFMHCSSLQQPDQAKLIMLFYCTLRPTATCKSPRPAVYMIAAEQDKGDQIEWVPPCTIHATTCELVHLRGWCVVRKCLPCS